MFADTNSIHKSTKINRQLKNLADSLKDSSQNLKSLDYLLINPIPNSSSKLNQENDDYRSNFNKSTEDLKNTTKSITKIEQSLENISQNQNRMESEIKRINLTNNHHSNEVPWRTASMSHLDFMEHRSDPSTEARLSVENKLKEAQQKLHNERISSDNRNSTFSKSIDLSADLKAAIIDHAQSQNSHLKVDKEQMEILQRRVVRAESENSSLKFELEAVKRQYLNESGAKNSLMIKLDSSKTNIDDLQNEIGALRKQLDLISIDNDINRKKADTNVKLQERLNALQRENEVLKQNNSLCSHFTEIEDLRRQKDQAERKQATSLDHITEIMKQVDSKQIHITRLMDEVRDLQEQLSQTKKNFHDLDQRFHENQNELSHRLQINKESLKNIENLEHSLIELESDKNKGFSIRDDEIERLEKQSARLKNEIEKLNVHLQENSTLNVDLHNDNECLLQKLNTANFQTDALRKEMESLLKARSIQDELMKRKENDNQSYHLEIGDLKAQIEAEEKISQKYKYDAEVYSQELNEARETIAVQEERITSFSTISLNQKEELSLLKYEISKQKDVIGKLENQISYCKRQVDEYREREENIENLKRKLAESQDLYEKSSNVIVTKTKKLDSERNNRIKKLEQLLEAERGACKVLMIKCDRQILEINRLHQEYWNREQLVQEYKKRYSKIKDDMEVLIKQEAIEKDHLKNSFNEDSMDRERELNIANDKYIEVMEERDQIFRWIISDLDGVVELLSQINVMSTKSSPLKSSNYLLVNQSVDLKSCPPSSSALSILGGLDISKSFIDIKSKISWIRSEINMLNNQHQNQKETNTELIDELNVSNERLRILEDEKKFSRDAELEEARKCISKLKIREKNETNLQLKCDRLQDELHQVRQYLNATLGENCHRPSHY